jgi:hypothetical protein
MTTIGSSPQQTIPAVDVKSQSIGSRVRSFVVLVFALIASSQAVEAQGWQAPPASTWKTASGVIVSTDFIGNGINMLTIKASGGGKTEFTLFPGITEMDGASYLSHEDAFAIGKLVTVYYTPYSQGSSQLVALRIVSGAAKTPPAPHSQAANAQAAPSRTSAQMLFALTQLITKDSRCAAAYPFTMELTRAVKRYNGSSYVAVYYVRWVLQNERQQNLVDEADAMGPGHRGVYPGYPGSPITANASPRQVDSLGKNIANSLDMHMMALFPSTC